MSCRGTLIPYGFFPYLNASSTWNPFLRPSWERNALRLAPIFLSSRNKTNWGNFVGASPPLLSVPVSPGREGASFLRFNGTMVQSGANFDISFVCSCQTSTMLRYGRIVMNKINWTKTKSSHRFEDVSNITCFTFWGWKVANLRACIQPDAAVLTLYAAATAGAFSK